MAEELLDTDGENRAVRAFLMHYGTPGLTVAAMKNNLRLSGFPFWPEWVEKEKMTHLTKGGAQHWLRHLFALEVASPPAAAVQASLSDERILHLWDTHVAYETAGSAKQPPLDDKDKLAFARALFAAGSPVQVQAGGEGGAEPKCKFCGVDTDHPCKLASCMECQNFGYYPSTPSPTTSGGVRVDAPTADGAALQAVKGNCRG